MAASKVILRHNLNVLVLRFLRKMETCYTECIKIEEWRRVWGKEGFSLRPGGREILALNLLFFNVYLFLRERDREGERQCE